MTLNFKKDQEHTPSLNQNLNPITLKPYSLGLYPKTLNPVVPQSPKKLGFRPRAFAGPRLETL